MEHVRTFSFGQKRLMKICVRLPFTSGHGISEMPNEIELHVMTNAKHTSTLGASPLTQIAHPTRSANSMNVFLNVRGKVEVNHMLHVRNIQTASCHLHGNNISLAWL